MIKTVAKVVVAGVAVAATAEILRRTGVIQKIADKVQDMASDVLLRQFVGDDTPGDDEDELLVDHVRKARFQ